MPRRDSERTDSGCVCRCFLSARYPGRNVRRQLGLCWPFPYPQTMQRQHTIQMFDRHRSQKENLQGRRVARCRRVSAWCSTQHGYRTARLRNSGTLDFVSIRTLRVRVQRFRGWFYVPAQHQSTASLYLLVVSCANDDGTQCLRAQRFDSIDHRTLQLKSIGV